MENSKKYWWSSGCGRLEFELPQECVVACSHPGQCDDEVEYWEEKIKIPSTREHWIETLEGYGAWSLKELKALCDYELRQKLIWIAAGDIAESEDFED